MKFAWTLLGSTKRAMVPCRMRSWTPVMKTVGSPLSPEVNHSMVGFRLLYGHQLSGARSNCTFSRRSSSFIFSPASLLSSARYLSRKYGSLKCDGCGTGASRPFSSSTKKPTTGGSKQTDDEKQDGGRKGRGTVAVATAKKQATEATSSGEGAEEEPSETSRKQVPIKKDTSDPKPKKRAKRKGTSSRTTVIDEYGYNYEEKEEESFPITAYALCEEFDLKELHKRLNAQGLYIPTVLSDDLEDVIHVSAKYPIGNESREIFFFREGAVVFWNVSYLERVNVLKFLKVYQDESYDEEEIEEECEYMHYSHADQGPTRFLRGKVILGDDPTNKILEKYTFANALASSVKLGIWESLLEKYVEGIENITEALKRAEEIKLSRGEVLQKTGELFALRHQLNLHSDLLDTPDFYWERERLETLYQKTCDYLSINRRTKVMNEKLTQCCELLDLISSHLTDQHHTRLEWMIIVLIMIEVGFEILHLLERYEIIHI